MTSAPSRPTDAGRVFLTVGEPPCVGSRIGPAHTARWLEWALGSRASDRQRTLVRAAVRRAGIEQRSTCVADHTHCDDERLELYTRGADGVLHAPLDARMAVFERTATALVRRALAGRDRAPDHLVQVSCTGYSAPTAVQVVAAERGWHDATRLLSLGHMGCHAAVPALRAAADAVSSTARRRDRPADASLVHVELCSLHLGLDPARRDWITHATLFADGAARVDVTTEPPASGFELVDDFESLVPGTGAAMTWRLAPEAFRMHLGAEVVGRIRAGVRTATESFLARNGLGLGDVDCFAIHPGGPRILETCADALGIGRCSYRHAADVFRAHGNMSSATVPHIWSAVLADTTVADGALVCTLAFGPGLTVTGNLLRVVRRSGGS